MLEKAAATLHQAVFKSGFSFQFQEAMAAPSTVPRMKASESEQLRSRSIHEKRLSKAKETLKIADGTTMDLQSHHSRQRGFDSLGSCLQEITRLPDIDDATWAEARNIHIDEAAKGSSTLCR